MENKGSLNDLRAYFCDSLKMQWPSLTVRFLTPFLKSTKEQNLTMYLILVLILPIFRSYRIEQHTILGYRCFSLRNKYLLALLGAWGHWGRYQRVKFSLLHKAVTHVRPDWPFLTYLEVILSLKSHSKTYSQK